LEGYGLIRWLVSRMRGQRRDASAAAVSSALESSASNPDFRLEQLEPRVLLSADLPLAAGMAKSLIDDDQTALATDGDAGVLRLQVESTAELQASLAPAPAVSWGAGWSQSADVSVGPSASTAAVDLPSTAPIAIDEQVRDAA
jgi:hypothetical protein